MYQDINNPALFALMGVFAILAFIFLSTGLKALAKRTNHFDVLTPVFNSCFNCTGGHVVAPDQMPEGRAVKELEQTTIQCREMLRDETRLNDKDWMEKWSWIYDQEPQNYTEIAVKCPQFTPKLVNKDGSIG